MVKGRWYQKQKKESCILFILVLKTRWNFNKINKIKLPFPFLFCRQSLPVFFGFLFSYCYYTWKIKFWTCLFFSLTRLCSNAFFNFSQTQVKSKKVIRLDHKLKKKITWLLWKFLRSVFIQTKKLHHCIIVSKSFYLHMILIKNICSLSSLSFASKIKLNWGQQPMKQLPDYI